MADFFGSEGGGGGGDNFNGLFEHLFKEALNLGKVAFRFCVKPFFKIAKARKQQAVLKSTVERMQYSFTPPDAPAPPASNDEPPVGKVNLSPPPRRQSQR
jgi:hypothetical protein